MTRRRKDSMGCFLGKWTKCRGFARTLFVLALGLAAFWMQPGPARAIELTEKEQAWLAEHPKITLGFAPDFQPHVIVGEDGRLTGILIDLYGELAPIMGLKVNMEIGPWAKIINEIKGGRIDGFLLSAEALAKSVGLLTTKYIWTAMPTVFARTDAPFRVNSLKDLTGKKVATLKGVYMVDQALKPHRDQIELIETDSALKMLTLVFEGKADAAVGLQLHNYLINKHMLVGIEPVFFSHKHRQEIPASIRAEWPEFIGIMNKAMDKLGRTRINEIIQRWILIKGVRTPLELTQKERAWISEHPVLRLGYDVDWPPVEFADEEGNYKGMSADYMALIAETLGVTVAPAAPQSWQATIDAAKKGEIELLSAVARTPQRESYLRFTRPYLSFPIVIVTDQRVAYISEIKELAGKTVAVVSDYASHDMLVNNHPDLALKPVKDINTGLQAVRNGEAYAFVGSLASISHIMGREGIAGLKVTGETPYSYDLAIGVRKDQPVLAGLLQKALDAITEDKKLEIYNRWIAVAYERGFDHTLIWKVLVPIVLIIIVLVNWNRQLNRMVARRSVDLKTSEAKFRDLVENIPVGIVLTTFDGKTLEANPAMVKMLGYASREEALSVPTIDNYEDPSDRKGLISAIEKLEKGMLTGYEARFRHRGGFPIWVSLTVLVLFTREGEKQLLSVIEDITERKANELELEKHRKHLEELVDERTTELRRAKEVTEEANRSLVYSEERLALALKGGDLGFWDVNLVTGEMVVNRRWREMFGHAPDALDNLTRDKWIRSLHPDDRDRVLQIGEAYRRGETDTYEVEYRVTTRSGEVCWQFSKGEIVERNDEQGVLRMVGTVMDITPRKEAEEKLKQYMDDLERFNRLAVGREKQIISLKQTINSLLGQLGQEPKYKSVE